MKELYQHSYTQVTHIYILLHEQFKRVNKLCRLAYNVQKNDALIEIPH